MHVTCSTPVGACSSTVVHAPYCTHPLQHAPWVEAACRPTAGIAVPLLSCSDPNQLCAVPSGNSDRELSWRNNGRQCRAAHGRQGSGHAWDCQHTLQRQMDATFQAPPERSIAAAIMKCWLCCWLGSLASRMVMRMRHCLCWETCRREGSHGQYCAMSAVAWSPATL